MSNQTIKNDPDNKGRDKLDEQLRSIWLPLPSTLRMKYYQAVVNIYRQIELFKEYLGGDFSGNGCCFI